MNKLANESSLYLKQHADNPVEWYPWGDEALGLAARENKPILLSIGYSACHWCHVMAHESFEDPSTAEVMNRLFVNVKVDREERPDLDKIYQTAHQLLNQRGGGWPLTVFLTPQGQLPFFAGTYFPNEPRHGMPSFTDLLVQVAQGYETHKADLDTRSEALVNALQQLQPGAGSGAKLNDKPLSKVRDQLAGNFDKEWGGFGDAPKFPHTSNLELLLRHWRSSANSADPDVDALFMTALTMSRMQNGGLYDQIGGGFFRYSVDREWQIPHFEKMLYDNGPLLALCSQLWQASGDDSFRRVASQTADWVLRDMLSPDGGFYSTLDADSEGEEGKFYVWTPDEVEDLLDIYENTAAKKLYGLDGPANFEGNWHLTNHMSLDDLFEQSGYTKSRLQALLDSAQAKLLAVRNERVWPGRDEKILTAWNALMIRGLAIASTSLQRPELADAATNCVDFIRTQMVNDDRLAACFADGKAQIGGYLDDYAFLLDAVIELLQVRWNNEHLGFAVWLADKILELFGDEDGGFFFTAHDAEELLYRPKTISDDSLPSGNAVAAQALNRLGSLLGETRYLSAAEKTLQMAWEGINDFPHGHAAMLIALREHLEEIEIIILRGDEGSIGDWSDSLHMEYAPGRLIFAIPADTPGLPEGLAVKQAQDGSAVTAYICRGTSCSAPLTDAKALEETLRND